MKKRSHLVAEGYFDGPGMPETVRFSTAVRGLRRQGFEESALKLEELKRLHGSSCAVHGTLEDPIIGTVPHDQVAFGCPWCSGPDMLAAWEKEGMRS